MSRRGLGLGVVALLLCGGCGYRAMDVYRPGIRTIHVELFGSRAFRRDLEYKLTEALKKRVNRDTPYRLAPPEEADTILKGEILEVRQAAFARDFLSRQPRDIQLTLAARVQWQDVRSGQMLVDQPIELQSVDYLTPTGETEEFAQERAIDQLAAKIVARMYRDDW